MAVGVGTMKVEVDMVEGMFMDLVVLTGEMTVGEGAEATMGRVHMATLVAAAVWFRDLTNLAAKSFKNFWRVVQRARIDHRKILPLLLRKQMSNEYVVAFVAKVPHGEGHMAFLEAKVRNVIIMK